MTKRSKDALHTLLIVLKGYKNIPAETMLLLYTIHAQMRRWEENFHIYVTLSSFQSQGAYMLLDAEHMMARNQIAFK